MSTRKRGTHTCCRAKLEFESGIIEDFGQKEKELENIRLAFKNNKERLSQYQSGCQDPKEYVQYSNSSNHSQTAKRDTPSTGVLHTEGSRRKPHPRFAALCYTQFNRSTNTLTQDEDQLYNRSL